jgi:hypothetical protein
MTEGRLIGFALLKPQFALLATTNVERGGLQKSTEVVML